MSLRSLGFSILGKRHGNILISHSVLWFVVNLRFLGVKKSNTRLIKFVFDQEFPDVSMHLNIILN